jgi:YidC/Oxa1 family membrane protein insertase
MTILIKVVLYPLTQSQMKSMRSMQQLQPKIKEIQERYKDDPQKMQSHVMSLYKERGANPLSGCLPLLIQLPILMAFYQSLFHFKYAVAAHAAFLWVPNLSAKDPYFIFAVLAGLTTYYQQKISTVDTKDPTQKTMLIVMPFFIAWMAATFPAGLGLYWVIFNVLGIAQQLWVNRQLQPATAEGAGVVETSTGGSDTRVNTDAGRGKGGGKNQNGNRGGKKGKNS